MHHFVGIVFKCSGTDGHGSLLHKNTAAEKVRIIINKLLDYRATQVARLESDPNLQIGDVTTVNLTMLRGGIQDNVVPPEMTIGFDIRLAIDVDQDVFYQMVKPYNLALKTSCDAIIFIFPAQRLLYGSRRWCRVVIYCKGTAYTSNEIR